MKPFKINFPDTALEDLQERLKRTRWPDEPAGIDWSYGIPVAFVKEIADYWCNAYDWRKQEARLNEFSHFNTQIDGQNIHFMHVRSPEPQALPLILTHGWPGSFLEFIKIAGPLANPREHGADPADAFHVVVPSIPGFGLSGPTREVGWTTRRVAGVWAELMRRLGYERYVAHGNDTGALISRALGLIDGEHIAALHLNQIFSAGVTPENADLSVEAEQRGVEAYYRYEYELGGYAAIQGTRPQLMAYGLNDSPAALLAWIADIVMGWTGSKGGPEDPIDRDTLLNNVMIYWLTGTAGSSARYYKEGFEAWGEPEPHSPIPTAVAVFPDDMFVPLRRLAETNHNIVRWTEFERGGHFAAWEVPELLIEDLRASFRDYR